MAVCEIILCRLWVQLLCNEFGVMLVLNLGKWPRRSRATSQMALLTTTQVVNHVVRKFVYVIGGQLGGQQRIQTSQERNACFGLGRIISRPRRKGRRDSWVGCETYPDLAGKDCMINCVGGRFTCDRFETLKNFLLRGKIWKLLKP